MSMQAKDFVGRFYNHLDFSRAVSSYFLFKACKTVIVAKSSFIFIKFAILFQRLDGMYSPNPTLVWNGNKIQVCFSVADAVVFFSLMLFTSINIIIWPLMINFNNSDIINLLFTQGAGEMIRFLKAMPQSKHTIDSIEAQPTGTCHVCSTSLHAYSGHRTTSVLLPIQRGFLHYRSQKNLTKKKTKSKSKNDYFTYA